MGQPPPLISPFLHVLPHALLNSFHLHLLLFLSNHLLLLRVTVIYPFYSHKRQMLAAAQIFAVVCINYLLWLMNYHSIVSDYWYDLYSKFVALSVYYTVPQCLRHIMPSLCLFHIFLLLVYWVVWTEELHYYCIHRLFLVM